jgi:ABC-type branched-subunit amino acid transport system substrate-binding protein
MRRIAPLFFVCALAACAPRYSDLPMTPSQNMAQAEDALRRGEYATAVSGFSDYLATGETTFRARAFFELAQAQYGLENYEAALDILNDLEERYPGEDWPQIPALRGDIYYALGKRADAIRQWDIAWERGSDGDRQFLRARIEEAVDELTPAQAAELTGELQSDDVRTMLAGRAPGGWALAPSVAPEPAPHLSPPPPAPVAPLPKVASPPAESESPAAVEAAALGTLPSEPLDIDAGDAANSGVGVAALLPLTGPDRAYGQRALSGLRLAFTGFPRMLTVRDTGGQPDLAAQLLVALADQPNIVAVIGPLRSGDATAVAPLAERLQMPMLLLAREEGLTGPYVLQTVTTQQEQMRALAAYAVRTLGLQRLGILYPDDAYGRSFAGTFRDEATRVGAALVKSNAYRPGAQTFAPQTAAVAAWVSADGVQGVFIPDAAPVAVKVAAAARTAAPQIQLLGTESWNQPDILATAGKSIDGAVFADSFFVGSGTPSTADFVSRFRAENNYDPSGFEAQAYDAGMLTREAIAKGARTRGAVLQFLRAVTRYEGASAIASGADGLKPDLVLLQVRDGRVATISR